MQSQLLLWPCCRDCVHLYVTLDSPAFLLALASCALITLNCIWLSLAIAVFFQLIPISASRPHFQKVTSLSFLVHPPGRGNLIVLFAFFPLLWMNSTGPMAVSRLINNSGIRGVSWNKIWLLRQQGLGVGRFPLERV